MVYSRFHNLEPEKQQRLIRVAAEEFAERGYESASLNRIIDRAGMSKGQLYYYFEDKADLYATAVERATALIIEAVGGFSMDSLTEENFWSTFDRLMRDATASLDDNPWFMKLLRSFYRLRSGPAGRQETERVLDVVRHWTREILARGQQLGTVRSDLPLDFLVEVAMGMGEAGDRWLANYWDRIPVDDHESMLTGYMKLFRRLLEPA